MEEVWGKLLVLKATGDESDEGNVYFLAKRKTKNVYLLALMDHAGGFSEEDMDILEKKGVSPFKPEATSTYAILTYSYSNHHLAERPQSHSHWLVFRILVNANSRVSIKDNVKRKLFHVEHS